MLPTEFHNPELGERLRPYCPRVDLRLVGLSKSFYGRDTTHVHIPGPVCV